MRVGYILVSKEFISTMGVEIQAELDGVFTEVCRKEIGSGLIEIHGESDLFDLLPEGATKRYDAIFMTTLDGVKFVEFK